MGSISYFLALFGVLFLIVALLAWSRILRKPDASPPTRENDRRAESAAMVIVIAFLLSAVAAVVGVIGFIQR
jgi:uncharacterized membrane protein YfcA